VNPDLSQRAQDGRPSRTFMRSSVNDDMHIYTRCSTGGRPSSWSGRAVRTARRIMAPWGASQSRVRALRPRGCNGYARTPAPLQRRWGPCRPPEIALVSTVWRQATAPGTAGNHAPRWGLFRGYVTASRECRAQSPVTITQTVGAVIAPVAEW